MTATPGTEPSADGQSPDGPPDGASVGLDNGLVDALVRSRRFFTRGEVSPDLRTLHKRGGRTADDF